MVLIKFNIVSKLVPNLLDKFGAINEDDYNEYHLKIAQLIGLNALIFPVFLIKNLSGLRYFSVLGVIGVIYTAVVIFNIFYSVIILGNCYLST